jgi:ABC-type phosphate transport system auxiliary subunit
MKLTDEEMNSVFENIGEYCRESDGQIRLVYGESCNVDRVVDNMPEWEKMQMTKEVIREVMEKLKAKKKKKQKETETEEETEQETNANESETETEQEQEVENK